MLLDMKWAVLLHLELQLQSTKHFQHTIHAARMLIQLRLVGGFLLHLGLHCQLFILILHLCVAAQLRPACEATAITDREKEDLVGEALHMHVHTHRP